MNPDITSTLTEFIPGQLIESLLMLTVPNSGSVLVNGIVLQCITAESVANETVSSDSPSGIHIYM